MYNRNEQPDIYTLLNIPRVLAALVAQVTDIKYASWFLFILD